MTILNQPAPRGAGKTAKRQRGSSLQRVALKDGSIRWRFRLDLAPDPKTGRRRQRTLTYKTEAEAIKAGRRKECSRGADLHRTRPDDCR